MKVEVDGKVKAALVILAAAVVFFGAMAAWWWVSRPDPVEAYCQVHESTQSSIEDAVNLSYRSVKLADQATSVGDMGRLLVAARAAAGTAADRYDERLAVAPDEIGGDLETMRDSMRAIGDGEDDTVSSEQRGVALDHIEAYAKENCYR